MQSCVTCYTCTQVVEAASRFEHQTFKPSYEVFAMTLEQLRNITSAQIPDRSNDRPTNNAWRHAKVVSIYDGDTCDLVIINNRRLKRFVCRLASINTPELNEGGRARKARDFLGWLSMGKNPVEWHRGGRSLSVQTLQRRLDDNRTLVQARFQGVGVFGRSLVTLRKDNMARDSFNELLMEHGYAEIYRYQR